MKKTKFNKFFKKAQGLPLNTIVIAMLVIIVMVVIVVFFTKGIGDSGDKLEGASDCSFSNPLISTDDYKSVKSEDSTGSGCGEGEKSIATVILPKKNGKAQICCGTPQSK